MSESISDIPSPTKRQGLFICLEGLDGSGKSTQLLHLQEELSKRGHQTLKVREPGGTEISEKIRNLILNPSFSNMNYVTELLLYSAARAQLLAEVIAPALQNGRVVLADRFAWSTLAYQGYGRGLDTQLIADLNRIACGSFTPHLTFILDIPVEIFRERSVQQGRNPDRLEQENGDFFARVRHGYQQIAKDNPDICRIVDGTQPPMSVARQIANEVIPLLP